MFAGAQTHLTREENQRYEGGIPVIVGTEQFNFEINAKRGYFKFVYIFRLVLESQQKLVEGTEISHISPAPHIHSFPLIHIIHQNHDFVTVYELTRTHHFHP